MAWHHAPALNSSRCATGRHAWQMHEANLTNAKAMICKYLTIGLKVMYITHKQQIICTRTFVTPYIPPKQLKNVEGI